MLFRTAAYAWAVGLTAVEYADSCRARTSIGRALPATVRAAIARKTVSAGPPTAGVCVSPPVPDTSLAVFHDTIRMTWAVAGAGRSRANETASARREKRVTAAFRGGESAERVWGFALLYGPGGGSHNGAGADGAGSFWSWPRRSWPRGCQP